MAASEPEVPQIFNVPLFSSVKPVTQAPAVTLVTPLLIVIAETVALFTPSVPAVVITPLTELKELMFAVPDEPTVTPFNTA